MDVMNTAKTINLSDIKIEFGGKNPPKDDYMMELLGKAYKGELLCKKAAIKIEGIVPFSDFKPEIEDWYRKSFYKDICDGLFCEIFVYPKDGKFVMSDDFSSYYLHLEKGDTEILCVVLGEAEGPFVLVKGEPFKLQPPTYKVVSKE